MKLSNPSACLSSCLGQSLSFLTWKHQQSSLPTSLPSISLALILLEHNRARSSQVSGSFPSLSGRTQHLSAQLRKPLGRWPWPSLQPHLLQGPLRCSQTNSSTFGWGQAVFEFSGDSQACFLSGLPMTLSVWTTHVPFCHSANSCLPFRYLCKGQFLPEDLPACSLFFLINNLNKYLSSG